MSAGRGTIAVPRFVLLALLALAAFMSGSGTLPAADAVASLPAAVPITASSTTPTAATTPELLPSIRRMFARFDLDRDERLSPKEWGKFVRTEDAAPLDFDGDGSISPAEFSRSFFQLSCANPPDETAEADKLCSEGDRLVVEAGFQKALEVFQRAQQSKPGYMRAEMGLARCHRELGRLDQAEAAYRRALAVWPNFPPLLLELALLEDRMGKRQQANRDLWNGLSMFELHLAMFGKIGSVVKKGDPAANAFVYVVIDYLAHSSQAEEAVKVGRWAERVLGSDPLLEVRTLTAEAQAGKPEQALRRLDEALAAGKAVYAYLHAKGQILEHSGKLPEAMEIYRKALEDPQCPQDAFYIRMDMVRGLLHLNRDEEAGVHAEAVLRSGREPALREELRDIYRREGRAEQGRKLLERFGPR